MGQQSRLWLRLVRIVPLVFVLATAVSASAADNPAIARARQAVQSGSVVPQRDLAPLVEALRQSHDPEEQSRLIDVISGLGAVDAASPAAVKAYLLERSTPVLLEIGRTGATNFLKGDALFALRNMGASRAVLEQAAAIAEADPDDYVQSRGEILRNFIKGMPAEGAAAAHRATDPAKEQAALASLKQRGLGASADQLGRSAQEGDAETVKALLEAGIDPNAGPYDQRPLYRAVFSGCSAAGGDTAGLVDTVKALIAGGADLAATNDHGGTVLFSAAQMCGPQVVGALVAGGAKVNVHDSAGMSPLSMALIMQKLDSAELLAAKGARLTAQEVDMVSASATDPRARAVLKKAGAK